MIDTAVFPAIEHQHPPYPLLFISIGGEHLYGFPSPDSDYDLRGVHVLPVRDVIGLDAPEETIEIGGMQGGIEIDLVTHDVRKFFTLLLKRNGYVLEQLYSPLIVHTTPQHDALKHIARDCITRHHSHHYLGFARSQWHLFNKSTPRHIKPLLYTFRVLLTGIHLMRTGRIEANLLRLNESFDLPYLPELIERKVTGAEKATLPDGDIAFYQREYDRLVNDLEAAHDHSNLPEQPGGHAALNDLLLRIRLGGLG